MTGRNAREAAALFRARRKDLGLTQAQAAERAGVALPTWVRFESGAPCSATTKRAVAQALGWEIDAHTRLLTGEAVDSLDKPNPEALSRAEGIDQVTTILHRMGMTPDRIDISLAVIKRLSEEP